MTAKDPDPPKRIYRKDLVGKGVRLAPEQIKWLATQPGTTSEAIRRLIDAAMTPEPQP